MKREELLKLPKGRYLVTDDICNHKYVLIIYQDSYEYGKFVGSLYDYHYYNGTPFSPHTAIFYSKDEIEVDFMYSKLEVKNLNGNTSMGGIVASFDFNSSLRSLRLVGVYNKETISDDMKRFRKHLLINSSRYDKKRLRKFK